MTANNKTPVFVLSNIVFPQGLLALRIFETRYIDMVREAMRNQSSFVITSHQSLEESEIEASIDTLVPHDIGTKVKIIDFEQLPDSLLGITVQGEEKVHLQAYEQQDDGLWLALTSMCAEEVYSDTSLDSQVLLVDLLKKILPEVKSHYKGVAENYINEDFDDAAWVGARLVEVLPMDIQMKVELLRLQDSDVRLQLIQEVLERMQVI